MTTPKVWANPLLSWVCPLSISPSHSENCPDELKDKAEDKSEELKDKADELKKELDEKADELKDKL